ncbi:MAG TPA: hypothetical protein PKK50_09395 [Myxococcota bacterium]|nr:hypothetical protein [Myxococcota bacterium]
MTNRFRLGPATMFCLLATLTSIGCASLASPDSESTFPLIAGDFVNHDWRVDRVRGGNGQVSIKLTNGSATASFDLTESRGRTAPNCTHDWCVEPTRGQKPPAELVQSLVTRLSPSKSPAGTDGHSNVSAVKGTTARMASTFRAPGRDRLEPLLSPMGIVSALMVLLLICCSIIAGVHAVRVMMAGNRIRLAVTLAMTAIIAIMMINGIPGRLNPGGLAILQDGTSLQNIQHLYGRGVHDSPLSELAADLLSNDDGLIRLPSVVAANRILNAFNAALFFLVVAAILRSWLFALPFTWVFASSQATLVSSTSEYPTPVLTLLFLLAMLQGFVIARSRQAGRLLTAAGLGGLLAITFLATGFRPEAGVAAAIVLVTALAAALVPIAVIDDVTGFVRGWFGEMLAKPLKATGIVVAFVVLGTIAAVLESRLSSPVSWFAGAVNPFNSGFSDASMYLSTFVPIGVLILALVGFAATILRPLRFLLFPAVTLLLLKLHAAAGGVEFNHWFRLMTTDFPLVMVLAAFGLTALIDRLEKADLHRAWRVAVPLLIAAACLVPPASHRNPGGYETMPGSTTDVHRMRNPRIEVDFLMKVLDQYPECLFVTSAYDHGKWRPAWFGRYQSPTFERPSREYECKMNYLSLDCNFEDGPDCAELTEGADKVMSIDFRSAPYGQCPPYPGMRHRSRITLGVFKAAPTAESGPQDPGAPETPRTLP